MQWSLAVQCQPSTERVKRNGGRRSGAWERVVDSLLYMYLGNGHYGLNKVESGGGGKWVEMDGVG